MKKLFYLIILFLIFAPQLIEGADLSQPKWLTQRLSNCEGSIAADHWIGDNTICLTAQVSGLYHGDQVKLEVELIPAGQDFANQPTHAASSFCSSTCKSSVVISELENGSYRWQARTINDNGDTSDWVEFSSINFAFGIDQIMPEGTIVAEPEAVAVNQSFQITVSGRDNQIVKSVCFKEEDDSNWTCYNCENDSAECQYSFDRSESQVKKYSYYGYILDVTGQGNFTDPRQSSVLVQTNPTVATLAVSDFDGAQATLAGYLTDLGGAAQVRAWFEYWLPGGNKQESTTLTLSQTGIFEVSLDNLDPQQIYHLRPVVENSVGRGYGQEIVSTELIVNGHFEIGTLDGWKTTNQGDFQLTESAHTGKYSGEFGFIRSDDKDNGTSAFYQNIFIPQNAGQINLSFKYNFQTYDYCDNAYFRFRLRDAEGQIIKTYEEWCCPAKRSDCRSRYSKVQSGWQDISADLSEYAGQSVGVYFEVWRRDDKRQSWAIIDEVSLSYQPIVLPQVETLSPLGVYAGGVIMAGDLTDTGHDSATEVWFVWDQESHNNWSDYSKATGSLVQSQEGQFDVFVGNLLSDTTYYFRAIAKNNAGLSFGQEETFTTSYATAGGWRLPDYYVDVEDRWSYEEQAYDWDTATRARNNGYQGASTDWRGYLEFYLDQPIRSNKIRVSGTGEGSGSGETISQIDILYHGQTRWLRIFRDVLPENHRLVEFGFSEGLIKAARIRRSHPLDIGGAHWVSTVGEFHFYEVPDEPVTEPTIHTLEAAKIERHSAILKGRVNDDGGELVKTRFKYWVQDNPQDVYYTDWDEGMTGETTGWATGEVFSRIVNNLEEGVSYEFQAQALNSLSPAPADGDVNSFFTQVSSVGWVSPTRSSGNWGDYEHYGYDDVIGTYTSINRGGRGSDPWSPWIDFERPGIFSNRIRFRIPDARSGSGQIIEQIQVRLKVDGQYKYIYNSDKFPINEWQEIDISSVSFDNQGNPLMVEGAGIRMRMTSNNYFPFEFDEIEFWKLPESPEVETGSANTVLEDDILEAEISGDLIYSGGVDEVEVWFEWRQEGQKYDSKNRTDPDTLTEPGSFWAEIGSELERGKAYYFRAVAENEFTTAYGQEKSFLTDGCFPGEERKCIAFEEGSHICSYSITCQDDGLWERCDLGNCAIDDHCHCEDEGYDAGIAICGENCLCDYSQCYHSETSPSVTNLQVTEPDYCLSDPRATFSWDFQESSGKSQSAYHLQVSQKADFSTLEIDSGRVDNSSDSYATGDNILEYNKTYYWRLMVWDTEELISPWFSGPSFRTPDHRYPRIGFSWRQIYAEELNWAAEFQDQSTVFGSNIIRDWQFSEGSPSTSNLANPTVSYDQTGWKNVSLEVTDGSGYSCQMMGEIQITEPVFDPGYREVLPIELE